MSIMQYSARPRTDERMQTRKHHTVNLRTKPQKIFGQIKLKTKKSQASYHEPEITTRNGTIPNDPSSEYMEHH